MTKTPEERPSDDQGDGTTDGPADGAADGSASYAAALAELEELLDELEGADIDVDRLAERVARGAELVRFCRARLDVVTNDVDAVVSELVPVDESAEGSP